MRGRYWVQCRCPPHDDCSHTGRSPRTTRTHRPSLTRIRSSDYNGYYRTGSIRAHVTTGRHCLPSEQGMRGVFHDVSRAMSPMGNIPNDLDSEISPIGEKGVTPRNGQNRTLRVGLAFGDRHLTNLRSGIAVSGAHVTGRAASIRSESAAASGTPIWDDYAAKGSSSTDETLAEKRPAYHQVGPG
jgi:hypothetical protein